jgi:hypothetical protein
MSTAINAVIIPSPIPATYPKFQPAGDLPDFAQNALNVLLTAPRGNCHDFAGLMSSAGANCVEHYDDVEGVEVRRLYPG